MKETPMQEEFDMEKELQQEFIQELAEFFKIFGDATRIRILQTLLEGERNAIGARISENYSLNFQMLYEQLFKRTNERQTAKKEV